MSMRLPGIGSQYLFAIARCETRTYFDGAKTYKVTLPKDIPEANLLVLHAIRQPDALDARHAAALPARGQPKLSVPCRRSRAPTAPTTVYFARSSLRESRAATGSRPMPGKGWFTILRLYSPLEPFFTKHGGRARSSRFSELESCPPRTPCPRGSV